MNETAYLAERLAFAEQQAWTAYLRALRRYGPDRLGYELAEPALWVRLQEELSDAKRRYGRKVEA